MTSKNKIKFNTSNFDKYLDLFNLSLEDVIREITTEKTKDKKKQEIEKDLKQGAISFSYLHKIAKYFKIDVSAFFFSEFRENKFILEFKAKHSKVLNISDYTILRHYQAIREDIAIFDNSKFETGTYNIQDNFYKDVAKEYRRKFELDNFLEKTQTADKVFNFLRDKIENEGIYVFKNNKGDRGQRQGLNENLQGCIFLDGNLPPLILINSDYPKTAQISTLLHEFSHCLLGKPEIEVKENFDKNEVEKWCNRFAYHFMINEEIEKEEIKNDYFNIKYLNYLSQKYFVSKASFMVRFKDKELNIVSDQEYRDFFNKPFFDDKKIDNPKKSGGGNYHTTKKERLSKKFLEVLSNSFATNTISTSEFAKYVGIKDQAVKEYLI